MIQITAQMRVLVAIKPLDGRKGIDSLARLLPGGSLGSFFRLCVRVSEPQRNRDPAAQLFEVDQRW